jgi:hypothetical protein
MFSTLVAKFERAVNAECEILRFSDHLRSSGHGAAVPPVPSVQTPSLTEWRIHDQCGVVVRMYAEYESFFVALIENWVKRLPQLYVRHSDLPEPIRTQHRVGLATILLKLGGDQYSGITESQAVAALSGVVTQEPYSLLADAFWVNSNANLRLETAREIIKKVGAGDPSKFLLNARALQDVLDSIDSSADQELKLLVAARNIASHDEIGEVEGLDVHVRRAKFLTAFAKSLAAYFEMLITQRQIEMEITACFGVVIHCFSGSVSGVKARAAGLTIQIGSAILAMTETDCFKTTIQSIQVNRVDYLHVTTTTGMEIGVKTFPALPINADLVLLG